VPEHLRPTHVKDGFARAAASYDAHAVLQREVAARLLKHLEFTRIKPERILDIGCGTGYFTRLLQQRFPRAGLTAVDIALPMLKRARASSPRRLPWRRRTVFAAADALELPFADTAFDLVASNLTLQWAASPERMLSEMRRVLAPGGLLLLSTFGRRTLIELRRSLAAIDPENAGLVLPFPDVTDLGDALMQLPLASVVTDTDLFTLTYADARSLVRELKALGASSTGIRRRPTGLYGRRLLKRLDNHYNRTHRMPDGRVRATFEVLYAQAWYADPRPHPAGTIPIRPQP